MRLSDDRILAIAQKMIAALREKKMLRLKGLAMRVEAEVQRVIMQDLMIEDEINAEIEKRIAAMKRDIPYGSAEYSAIFTQLKDQLCEQRNYIAS